MFVFKVGYGSNIFRNTENKIKKGTFIQRKDFSRE